MPNCDFYATQQDQLQLLDWLFAEKTCEVVELASAFDTPLETFHSASAVLAAFDRVSANGLPVYALQLQLYVTGASPPFRARRIDLDQDRCNGATFRYAADGWGLVQLHLARPAAHGLKNCHTNHFTQVAAEKLAPARPDMGTPEVWDFKKITAFSSRLNRKINDLSKASIGSRPVLPGAFDLWHSGIPLQPYDPASAIVTLSLKHRES